jgi:hypothetical protein
VPTVSFADDELPAVGVTEVGLKEQVGASTGVGDTEHVKVTSLSKPFTEATVIVEVLDWPAENTAGEAAEPKIVKSGVTRVSAREAVCIVPDELPVIVRLDVPEGVVAPVAMVKVEVPLPSGDGVTDCGLNEQVELEGSPPQVRATLDVKPFCEPIVTVETADLPMGSGVGLSDVVEIEKSGF